MEHHAALLALAIGLFVTTNVDDIFVLVGFFSDPRFKPRQIALGQLAGLAALYGASVAFSLLALVVPTAYIGFLGVLPIAIGVNAIRELRQAGEREGDAQDGPSGKRAHGNVLAVAAVTIANGGDNLGIYTPIFATRPGYDVALIGLVFAAMTFAWVGAAYWLTSHRTLGAPIRRHAHRLVPFVLVALGFYILTESGTLVMLRNWL
jgi:cadmium resistance protein CadD (predicted permease)